MQVIDLTLPELLSDPVRARIYIEVLLSKEITALELLQTVDINRSTLSHHLTRFVKEGVLNVRVQSIGRSVKYYSINTAYSEEIIVEGEGTISVRKRKAFLESASAHLQVISNIILERAKAFDDKPQKRRKGRPVTFTISFISDTETKIWSEEYSTFEKRFRDRCKAEIGDSKEPSFDYIAYCGLTPTRK
ncbi:MAG: ArsR family transcriptional regulator [Candidatus Thorarchaeota archaeon]|nr:MAG: ArsR family transcriptional regulator [Candidatus Thorarchaeota archaeon]